MFFMSKGFIYLLENVSDNTIKIGYTRGKVEKRAKQLLTGSSADLSIIKTIPTDFGYKTETYLHRIFSHKKVRGEWFNLTQEDIAKMEEICEKTEKNFQFLLEHENYFIQKL
jgi:hypothetical protein